MRRYNFEPKYKPVLTLETIKMLKKRKRNLSLTLGMTVDNISYSDSIVFLPYDEQIDIHLLDHLRVSNDDIFVVSNNRIFKLAFFMGGKYYKLKVIRYDTAPTLEINGIHMHRIQYITPLEDTKIKISSLGALRNMLVLDICTGLGYTAIESIKRGSRYVTTIEKDKNVLKIAEYNPWSWMLKNNKIEIILEDAFLAVDEFDNSSFDRVIHDPPRFSMAGELYSKEFYQKLYRILKRKGVLFHYIGRPGYHRKISITKGVIKRLREVGFKVRLLKEAYGALAIKL